MNYRDACSISATSPDLSLLPSEKRAVISSVKKSRVARARRIATRRNCKIATAYRTSQLTK